MAQWWHRPRGVGAGLSECVAESSQHDGHAQSAGVDTRVRGCVNTCLLACLPDAQEEFKKQVTFIRETCKEKEHQRKGGWYTEERMTTTLKMSATLCWQYSFTNDGKGLTRQKTMQLPQVPSQEGGGLLRTLSLPVDAAACLLMRARTRVCMCASARLLGASLHVLQLSVFLVTSCVRRRNWKYDPSGKTKEFFVETEDSVSHRDREKETEKETQEMKDHM